MVSIIFHPNERLCSFNYSKSSVVACSSNRVKRESEREREKKKIKREKERERAS